MPHDLAYKILGYCRVVSQCHTEDVRCTCRCMPCSMGDRLAPLWHTMMQCRAWQPLFCQIRSSAHPGTAL